ncbi:MAG: M55 family metallopeptidase [Clostridiales bacterium]|jgi:D-amino peptidase|nr:M55 family metallopeptidase [Clostridiales bacterium]
MKIFISADIEGTNGITDWNETDNNKPASYAGFARRMSLEVAAVCEGVNDYDPASEILVKDAHGSGRNIDHELLPENTWLNRAFSGHPRSMMDQLDSSFDASILTGYHSPGYTGGNPLAHTMTGAFSRVLINDKIASEFLISYYTSLYYGVPMIMAAGDKALMEIVNETDPDIVTVDTMSGFGVSTTSPHPAKTRARLREAAKQAVANAARLKDTVKGKLPKSFVTDIRFREFARANIALNYPGARYIDAHTVGFDCEDYFEFLRYFRFV